MLGLYDQTEGMVHFQLPCPACSRPVHVVANPGAHEVRWCCVPCVLVGRAPLALSSEVMDAEPLRPSASA